MFKVCKFRFVFSEAYSFLYNIQQMYYITFYVYIYLYFVNNNYIKKKNSSIYVCILPTTVIYLFLMADGSYWCTMTVSSRCQNQFKVPSSGIMDAILSRRFCFHTYSVSIRTNPVTCVVKSILITLLFFHLCHQSPGDILL